MPFILKRSEVMKSFIYRLFPVDQILDFINNIIFFLKIFIFFGFLNLIIISFFLFIFFKKMFYMCIIRVNPVPVIFNFPSTLKKLCFSFLCFQLQFLIEEYFDTINIIPYFSVGRFSIIRPNVSISSCFE